MIIKHHTGANENTCSTSEARNRLEIIVADYTLGWTEVRYTYLVTFLKNAYDCYIYFDTNFKQIHAVLANT